MQKLNRKLAPQIREVTQLSLPKPQVIMLDNGIPLYVLDYPGQEILKVEVLFRAGRPQELPFLPITTHQSIITNYPPGTARATARLTREGTPTRTTADIAEHLDFYGGSLSIPVSLDTSNFTLFSLRKYAAELLPIFAEILRQPTFPEAELETFRRTNIQELLVELEKVEVRAYRHITELIFGAQHPYGYNSTPETYELLTREALVRFFETFYTPANCLIFASGKVDTEVVAMLNQYFGQERSHHGPTSTTPLPATSHLIHQPTKPPVNQSTNKPIHFPHPGSLQTAIKIGRRLFARSHPDYDGMFVLNTILGGYFGSRLMVNIREKRGYTYNIYSTVDAMLHDGCFYIATEVTHDKVKATLKEIWAELKKLREQPIPEEELSMVRNYLLGMLLNGLDGPLNTSDVVKTLIAEGLPWEAFERLVETVRSITAEEMQALAQRYLRKEDFWVVTVGGE